MEPLCLGGFVPHSGSPVCAQLLDNDADGKVDDSDVVDKMVAEKYFLIVPATDAESETMSGPSEGKEAQATPHARTLLILSRSVSLTLAPPPYPRPRPRPRAQARGR